MILLALLLAIPPDVRIPAAKIQKIDEGALAVESEGELHAELLPSGNEVLLEGKFGRAFLFYPHVVKVIEIGLQQPESELTSCAPIADEKSYRDCLQRPARSVQFTLEGLQVEARAAQKLLDEVGLAKVQVQLSSFGIKLKGARDDAEARKALRVIYHAILGPLRLDN